MPPPAQPNNRKRKTLAERAGEVVRPAPASPNSRPPNSYVRATSIAAISRDPSLSSSASSRAVSGTSMRNVSNSSFSGSVGSGSRPPSAQSYRPQSAMAGNTRLQKPTSSFNRPSTSQEVHREEPGMGRTHRNRKGRIPFSSNLQDCPENIKSPKTRRLCKSYTMMSIRDISFSSAFTTLSLNGEQPQSAPKTDVEVPATPSQIPKLVPHVAMAAETPSPSKPPKKTPKTLPRYLNRESNTVIAWDTDSRLEEVENMCSQFKEKMDGATLESKSLKDHIDLYKIRSRSF